MDRCKIKVQRRLDEREKIVPVVWVHISNTNTSFEDGAGNINQLSNEYV